MDDFYASEKKFPLFQTCVKVGFVKLKKKKVEEIKRKKKKGRLLLEIHLHQRPR